MQYSASTGAAPETPPAAKHNTVGLAIEPAAPGSNALPVDQRILELVALRTGYPADSIGLQMRLLDDLNLDSIKATDLIAATAAEYGVAAQLDASTLANATLQEIADVVAAHVAAADRRTGGCR
ncbi:MAG: acyl carrier protein [Gemmatimonadaceae bacterium]